MGRNLVKVPYGYDFLIMMIWLSQVKNLANFNHRKNIIMRFRTSFGFSFGPLFNPSYDPLYDPSYKFPVRK